MNEFNNVAIGGRIRALREKTGYSREQFSEKADITPKFLYEIESGKKGMSAYTLYNIAAALKVNCDYILTGKSAGTNLDYIINILSTIDKKKIPYIERIIKEISEMP